MSTFFSSGGSHEELPEGLVPVPLIGRRFHATRRVRLGDANRTGRLRLDALARLLQDVGNDDFADAGLDPASPFVARRSVVWSPHWPRLGDRLSCVTFCGGLGSRWAERRTSITVHDEGQGRGWVTARVEVATIWVFLDDHGRPCPLPGWFLDTYGSAAAGRKVSTRLAASLPDLAAPSRPWALRATDLDILGHVNNAATWIAVEDELAQRGMVPRRAELDYHAPMELENEVRLFSEEMVGNNTFRMWLMCGDKVRAAARITCEQGT